MLMWQYKSQIGLPLDPLFLSLGHSSLPYPHELLKDEKLGMFIAPFNLAPFHPLMLFQAFNLWHSSKGVNTNGTLYDQAKLIFTSHEPRTNGYNRIYNDQPILVGDIIQYQKNYYVILASTGQFNAQRKRWEVTAVLSKPGKTPTSIETMPKANSLTELDYSYYQALFLALGKSFEADSTLAEGEASLASAIQDLASATKSYLDNVIQYLASATAGAGTAGTTLIPPISSMSSAWDSLWQMDIQSIKGNTDQMNQANDEALDAYQEAIDEVEAQEPKGVNQGEII